MIRSSRRREIYHYRRRRIAGPETFRRAGETKTTTGRRTGYKRPGYIIR